MNSAAFTGKDGGLKYLQTLGIDVPPFILVDHALHRQFCELNAIEQLLDDELSPLDAHARIIQHFGEVAAIVPVSVHRLYEQLVEHFGALSSVGITRSSSRFEDAAKCSYAGIFSSVSFDLHTYESFVKSLIAVWLSPFKDHVQAYTSALGTPKKPRDFIGTMGAIIQPYLLADRSGVVFSRSVCGAARATCYANYGAGETLNTLGVHQCELVEHQETFHVVRHAKHRLVLWPHKASRLALGQGIASALGELVVVGRYKSHLSKTRLPLSKAFLPCVGRSLRRQLYTVTHQLIEHLGHRDFEFEWVAQADRLFLVQLRAITALDASAFTVPNDMEAIVAGKLQGPIHCWNERQKVPDNAIVAVRNLEYSMIAFLRNIKGILTLSGSPHSHIAIVCREAGIPVYKISAQQFERLQRQPSRFCDGAWVFD
ncbi:hypothetical protein GNF76_05135 [Pseudomonas sp. CCM 7893]|uniref:Phosphoenolpyruvate synthase n=1 Tax=Pseudomonas spelaei TaxID=1055469 RepID=A0A6I3W0Q9_9PSED|nr:PEP/pyruvate-binding domain-containing protein [Pseudomonas spelaei]MUF03705.1 hypothetical protein [Pseudomonas spelaei]